MTLLAQHKINLNSFNLSKDGDTILHSAAKSNDGDDRIHSAENISKHQTTNVEDEELLW
jgi:hypothetical protein